MSSLNWPKALEDLATVKKEFEKTSESVSVMGFCMGGALTFAALASISGWKAGGVFYGIPDLNIFRLDKITANVLAHFGSEDPLAGFSDRQSAQKLKADCEKNRYPIEVK
jgi:carboxymethylenebutenolidase